MFNTAIRILGNGDDARDILQDSFVDMFLKLDSFRMESSFGAWFKRIVVNKSLNHLRKSRMVFQDSDDLSDIAVEEKREAPFEYNIRDVKKAVSTLPEGYRLVFDLYMFEDFSHKEIASELGISEATSKSQLSRAKKKLRERIETQAT
ncbi:MAG: RNA polymerase sigma factor (sigma-70 family) [Cryomorphaceae bacterium]|jgi:RNA polymerase sigma factor (sigma-70 family)